MNPRGQLLERFSGSQRSSGRLTGNPEVTLNSRVRFERSVKLVRNDRERTLIGVFVTGHGDAFGRSDLKIEQRIAETFSMGVDRQ